VQKVIGFLLASVLWFGAGSVAFADGMILPFPEALEPGYLTVRYHRVTARIEDGHAVTRVEQEFYNPHDISVTGRYLFPVPPEAILSRFEATVDGERQHATRQDATATNEELYAIIADLRDPSLLQYVDWESLVFDLTLPPGGARVMRLEYEEVLTPTGGLYRYRYVLGTERYSSEALDEVSVLVDLSLSSGLASLYSSSHDVTVERMGATRARVTWNAHRVLPTEDWELFFAPADGGFGGGLLTGERDGHGHFLFLFSPEAEQRQADVLPKDIVFVIDSSGSMSGDKIEQARDALHFILGQLGNDDRFTIIGFDDRLHVFDYALQPVEDGVLRNARRYLDLLSADGSTDLESALQTALEILLGSGERASTRMVVFLTDGLPTAGVTDEDLIASTVAQTNDAVGGRLHVFGVGYDVNTHLLDRLAADNGGTVTYVRPGENLELALSGFYAKVADPLLTEIEVAFDGMVISDQYPQVLPDLFQGSSLLLTGRYDASSDLVSVRVRGRAGNERREYVYHIDLAEAGGHDFVPRLWATRRVGALLDRVRVEGGSRDLEEEIRGLGLDYGIVTPYTTFVIAGQADGAASSANMDLYNRTELNQASGQVTIDARVQNQMYQQASQANLATGANVADYGGQSLARVGVQQVDLSLLRGEQVRDAVVTTDWIAHNVDVDRTVTFGSDEYFALAGDPEARLFLQSGRNVIFGYGGEVIAIQDTGDVPVHPVDEMGQVATHGRSNSQLDVVPAVPIWLAWLVPSIVGMMALGAAGIALGIYAVLRGSSR
jgi:Ca-activated chloride channel family protein